MKKEKVFGSSVRVSYNEMKDCFDVYVFGIYLESFEHYYEARSFIKRVAKLFRYILYDVKD